MGSNPGLPDKKIQGCSISLAACSGRVGCCGLEVGVEGVSDDLALGGLVGSCPLLDSALVAVRSAECVHLGPCFSDSRVSGGASA